MNLDVVFLASILGRGFDKWWKDVFQNPENSVFDVIGDSLGVIAILIGVIVFLIWGGKIISSQSSYVKATDHVGLYAIAMKDQRYLMYIN